MKIVWFLASEVLDGLNVLSMDMISTSERVEIIFLVTLGGLMSLARLALVTPSLTSQLENARRVR